LTPFRGRWCLRVVMVAPAYDIDGAEWLPLDSDPALDRRDGRTTVVLGELISGGASDLLDQPEPRLDDDALTVVLSSGERARRPGWLRAPRFAVIALLALGVGVSIGAFRRHNGEGHLRGGSVRHGIAETERRAVRAWTVSLLLLLFALGQSHCDTRFGGRKVAPALIREGAIGRLLAHGSIDGLLCQCHRHSSIIDRYGHPLPGGEAEAAVLLDEYHARRRQEASGRRQRRGPAMV
jgi:hypothetical protein